jgi:Zn-dependent hydrolases, including glyoxylases
MMAVFAAGGGVTWAASTPSPVDRAAALRMMDAWRAPVPPRHLIGNIYYVGAMGVSSYLITTPEGHVLLDTGLPDTPSLIARGVEQLGFKVSDIELILSSHAHFDHTGGHAAMQRLTGAKVVASAEDARVLESGGAADFIPFPKDLAAYEPVKVDRVVADGETVTLGGVTLTANITPGHTRGATTWTMDVEDGGRSCRVVFFSSASINPGTRLTGANAAYPEIKDDLERSFARFKAMTCDIFLAPHGGQFAMAEKFARLEKRERASEVLVDPEGWRRTIAAQEKAFREVLARESAAKAE